MSFYCHHFCTAFRHTLRFCTTFCLLSFLDFFSCVSFSFLGFFLLTLKSDNKPKLCLYQEKYCNHYWCYKQYIWQFYRIVVNRTILFLACIYICISILQFQHTFLTFSCKRKMNKSDRMTHSLLVMTKTDSYLNYLIKYRWK